MSDDASMKIAYLIIGMIVMTFASRCFFIFLGDRIKISEWGLETIRYAPLAALIAILAPEIFLPVGASSIAEFNLRLPNIWGGIAAIIAFYFTRRMIPTLVIGMAVYTAARFWFAL
jgi:branched-subunit amino acid transport protein